MLDQLVPQHACLLLELYGITCSKDFTDFAEDDVVIIEDKVQGGDFDGRIDLNSRANRLKYLGFDFLDVARFKFNPLTRKKLLGLGKNYETWSTGPKLVKTLM